MGLARVKNTFTNWRYLEDDSFKDVALATIIAHRFDGNPIWLFLIAPSVSGNTKAKAFGSGVGARSDECRFGLIWKVTNAIETYRMLDEVLRERFPNVRIHVENRDHPFFPCEGRVVPPRFSGLPTFGTRTSY